MPLHRASVPSWRRTVLLIVLLVTPTVSGCLGVANMQELKTRLGATEEEPPAPPRADARATPQDALVGEPVRFTATASTDPAGDGLEARWTFGDGGTGRGLDTTHTYTDVGVYPVTVTITDALGRTDTANLQVAVSRGNRAPVAELEVRGPTPPEVGDELTLDASGSSDPDGDPITYAWALDDGTTTGATVTHAFTAPGTYLVEVTARDPSGATGTASRIVAVELHRTHQGTLNVTDDVDTVEVPVAAEGRLAVNLTFNATAGVNDLDLVVRDAAGERVASANTTTPAGSSGVAWEEIVLPRDILSSTTAGTWTVEVVREQGVQVAYTLRVDQTFPTSGPSTR